MRFTDSRARVRTGGVWRALVAVAFALAALPLLPGARAATPLPLDAPNLVLSGVGSINAMAWQPDGGLVVAGDFRSINGEPHRNIARFRPDGTLDTTWNASIEGIVQALAVAADGMIYAGVFPPRPYTTTHALLRFHADGTQDAAWGPQFTDGVRAIAIGRNGAMYAGGSFAAVGGFARRSLVKLNAATGAVDPLWSPSTNGIVRTLAVDTDGAVFAGGSFTTVGTLTRTRIVKLAGSAAGAPDAAWNLLGVGDEVRSVVLEGNGGLFVGGIYTSLGGAPRHGLARVATQGNGALDSTWNPALDSAPTTMAVSTDGLYVAGGFTQIGGMPRQRLARLSLDDASVDPLWDPGASRAPSEMALDSDGVLYAAGPPSSIGSLDRDGLFALPATTLQDTTITITSIDPEPSQIDEPYTVSFVVDSATGTPTGSVTVDDDVGGSCETTLVGGAGSCVLTASAAGERSLKAVYLPDVPDFVEAEVETTHEVVRAETTILLSPGGFSVATEPVHFFANLGSTLDVDGGTVTIGDAESSCTAEVVFFTAECDVLFAHAGVHEVVASYSGDDTHDPAVSDPQMQIVGVTSTELAIVSHNPNPSIPGQPVTVSVDFTLLGGAIGPVPGVISIDVADGGPACTIVLPDTSCDITLDARGPLTLVASYAGNGDFSASTAFAEHSVNRLPIGHDDASTTNEDQPFTVNATDGVLANDDDPDGTSLVVGDPGTRIAGGIGGTVALKYDGSYEYTPPPDANGDATFEYVPSDGLENASAPATVTIHVRPVNDAPTFSLAANPHFGPGPAGARETPNFAQMTSAGPGESDHVLAWHVRTISDPSHVLTGDATIAIDGTLSTPLSGAGGTAMLAVALQDDGGTDNGGNDTSPEQTFQVTVSPGTDLSVAIYDGTDFVAGGGAAIYEITVRNLGGNAVTSALATIGASANLSGLEWTCEAFDGAACSASGTGLVSDTLTLPAGSSAIYELTANVAATPELPAEVTATIAVLTGVTDFNPANDTAHDVDATGIFEGAFDPPETPPGR